jgi:hypothetical protein
VFGGGVVELGWSAARALRVWSELESTPVQARNARAAQWNGGEMSKHTRRRSEDGKSQGLVSESWH